MFLQGLSVDSLKRDDDSSRFSPLFKHDLFGNRFTLFRIMPAHEVPVYPALATDANPSKHGERAISAVPAGVLFVLSVAIPGEIFGIAFHFLNDIGISLWPAFRP
jgi:hypothetical protein